MTPIIIGNESDTHVQAILDEMGLRQAPRPILVDAPRLAKVGFTLTLSEFKHGEDSLDLDSSPTGWLRRYAPANWTRGLSHGGLEATEQRSILSLIGSISRLGTTRWLTPIGPLLDSEDKVLQLKVATSLGYRVPKTIIASDPSEAIAVLGSRFIVKPIGGGIYWTEGRARAVYTNTLDGETAISLDFARAPFIAQELIAAVNHLRVVTVLNKAWVAQLTASGRPVDWREQVSAHSSWQESENSEVAEAALSLANALGVGYSSQDWIQDDAGLVFLDLNPGGQWLFLPSAIGESVTKAVVDFLVSESR